MLVAARGKLIWTDLVIHARTLLADHPLVTHKLTLLRDAGTGTAEFRALADELVTLLAYEATREVRVEPVTVQTPVVAPARRGASLPPPSRSSCPFCALASACSMA